MKNSKIDIAAENALGDVFIYPYSVWDFNYYLRETKLNLCAFLLKALENPELIEEAKQFVNEFPEKYVQSKQDYENVARPCQ